MRILILEDDPDVSFVLATMLARAGHEVVKANSLGDLGEGAAGPGLDLVIVDLGVIDYDTTILPDLGCPVVAMSGHPEADEVAAAMGAKGFLRKPFSPSELVGAVAIAGGDPLA